MPAQWTDPTLQPWAVNYELAAADLNTHLRNMLLALGGTTGHIGVRAYNTAAISVAHNTITALGLNSERYDTDPNGELHSNATNTTRLLCLTPGKYLAIGNAQFAANSSGRRWAAIRRNGTVLVALVQVAVNSGTIATSITVSTIVDLAVNDYLELCVFQDSGAALNVELGGDWSPEFMMAKV